MCGIDHGGRTHGVGKRVNSISRNCLDRANAANSVANGPTATRAPASYARQLCLAPPAHSRMIDWPRSFMKTNECHK